MKKLVSLVLAALMIISLQIPLCAAEFTDTLGKPYEEAVNYLAEKGIVNGKAEGIYAPDDSLTRAEMLAIILRAFGAEEIEPKNVFEDVTEEHWAYMYVEQAYAMGIVNGVSETEFAPNNAVTYEQAVKMVVAALGYEEDAQSMGGWPDGYIKKATELDILKGTEQEQTAKITRGSMAILMYNALLSTEDEGLPYLQDVAKRFPDLTDKLTFINTERIRGVYGGSYSLTSIEHEYVYLDALDLGANFLYFKLIDMVSPFKSDLKGYKSNLDKYAKKIAEYKKEYPQIQHVALGLSWADSSFCANDEYGLYHAGISGGDSNNAPCPNSWDYWKNAMLPRAELIASYPEFDGIGIDFEMYSTAFSSAYSSPCACDNCWAQYVKENQKSETYKKTEAEGRMDLLNSKQEYETYSEWFYGAVRKTVAKFRDAVHKVNPDIIFTILPDFHHFEGADALGTETHPVISFNESEYWGGMVSYKANVEELNKRNLPVLYAAGFYPGTAGTPMEPFVKITDTLPMYCAGYWLYGFDGLKVNESNLEEWYDVIRKTNEELPTRVANGDFTEMPEFEIEELTIPSIAGDTPTEEEWANAPETDYFENNHLGREYTKYTNETKAKMLYNEDYIFIRITAYENEMDRLSFGIPATRDTPNYRNDSIEVMWRNEGSSASLHAIIDINGTVWDSYSTGEGSEDAGYNLEGVSGTIKQFKDKWEMDFVMPLSLDGVTKAKKGDILRLNVYRTRPLNTELEEWTGSAWTPCYGSLLKGKGLWGYVHLD